VDVLIHEFAGTVGDADGHAYLPRAFGRARRNGTWVGWLEFSPRGTGGLVRRSPIETTQASRAALLYWATGLEHVYLEGALARAITAARPRGASSR